MERVETEKPDTYLTKSDPTTEDWLEYNKSLFSKLRGEPVGDSPKYAPFFDVDRHAERAGVEVEEFYQSIKDSVEPIGNACLKLVRSDMDDAFHIIVIEPEE